MYLKYMWSRRKQLGLGGRSSIPGLKDMKKLVGNGGMMILRQVSSACRSSSCAGPRETGFCVGAVAKNETDMDTNRYNWCSRASNRNTIGLFRGLLNAHPSGPNRHRGLRGDPPILAVVFRYETMWYGSRIFDNSRRYIPLTSCKTHTRNWCFWSVRRANRKSDPSCTCLRP